jgi:3-mercaptopyruvate sulfurtransferase SseA
MRSLATVVVASLFATGLASAQTKVTQPPPPMPPMMATSAPVEQPLESARRIDRDEASKLVKKHKGIYVDVRSKEAYETGHIPGAISIPLNELMQRLKEIPPGKTIITYCA